jgi:hypothetical protein
MANNIYLVIQDSKHLYGEVFLKAVVIAGSEPIAKRILVKRLRSLDIEPMWSEDLWVITKIGNNGHKNLDNDVVCIESDFKEGLPTGDYNHRTKNGILSNHEDQVHTRELPYSSA